jgi:hypothetical protein
MSHFRLKIVPAAPSKLDEATELLSYNPQWVGDHGATSDLLVLFRRVWPAQIVFATAIGPGCCLSVVQGLLQTVEGLVSIWPACVSVACVSVAVVLAQHIAVRWRVSPLNAQRLACWRLCHSFYGKLCVKSMEQHQQGCSSSYPVIAW